LAKRSSKRITKATVDKLQSGQTIWDADIPGFGVRANKSSKTFVLKTTVAQRQKWIRLGQYGAPLTVEQARKRALLALARIAEGKDPLPQNSQRSGVITINDLCDRYLTDHATPHKKQSSLRTDRKNIENHVKPLLGLKVVTAVTQEDIEAFKMAVRNGKTAPANPRKTIKLQGGGSVVRGGEGVANRCLALLSKMFNLAEDWGYRPQNSNPIRRIRKFKENKTERFLSKDELSRLGKALDSAEDDQSQIYPVAAIRLLLFTGARLSEILKLKWEYVDFDLSMAWLPDSKTGRKPLFLPDPAKQILKELPRLHENPYVIPGRKPGKHLVDLQRPWQKIRKEASITDVRLHDLRHTYASVAAQLGTPLLIIGSLLGHSRTATTDRYAHLADYTVFQKGEEIAEAIKTAVS
jgi:integrase